jgi:hypothetical protein
MSAVLAHVAGPQFVPATVTPLTPVEAAGRLQAYPETNRDSGPLLMALIWVETTGRPIAYNVGNITANERYAGEAWRPPWFEVGPNSSPKMLELNRRMNQGQAPRAFRAYPSFADGFHDYMSHLSRSYPEVLSAANTGSAVQFVDALSQRYSRDYGPRHYRTFSALQKRFAPFFSGLSASHQKLPPSQLDVTGGTLLLLALLVAKAVS